LEKKFSYKIHKPVVGRSLCL